jgi:RNA polymerase sigma factor (sigma-70 family)
VAVRPTTADVAAAQETARRVAQQRLGARAWEGIGVEDVVQEVLLRFAALDLHGIDNWEAWVVTATKNRCSDVMAAERRHGNEAAGTSTDLDGQGPDSLKRVGMWVVGPSAAAIRPQMLEHILAVLSDQERAIVARHLDGYSNADIAEEFGYASAQSVAVTITRARAKVRERFASPEERDAILNPQRPY